MVILGVAGKHENVLIFSKYPNLQVAFFWPLLWPEFESFLNSNSSLKIY
jgi:hypothetical protein